MSPVLAAEEISGSLTLTILPAIREWHAVIPTTALSPSIRTHSWLGVYSLSSGMSSNVMERKTLAVARTRFTAQTAFWRVLVLGLLHAMRIAYAIKGSMKWWPLATEYDGTMESTDEVCSAESSEMIESSDRLNCNRLARAKPSR